MSLLESKKKQKNDYDLNILNETYLSRNLKEFYFPIILNNDTDEIKI